MREEEKIFAGQLFSPLKSELQQLKLVTHNLNLDYNVCYEHEREKRNAILRKMLGKIGERFFLQGPVYFHYGSHTEIGCDFFANFNFTVQDDAKVTIGDRCCFGPNVTIVTPVHPMLPEERASILDENGEPQHMCYAKPVSIGNDCWLGANVVVCPGVRIGDGCVIGAGSIIVKDIPPRTFAAGNPCRVIRLLTERDSLRYHPELLGCNRLADTEE